MLRNMLPAVALALAAAAGSAQADEQLTPLAASGDWIAMAHSESAIAPPDVCAAMSVVMPSVALRSGSDGVEFRVVNPDWSLPAEVSGAIQVTIGAWNATLPVDRNTDNMVGAELPAPEVEPLLDAASKAAAMTVVVGNAKPFRVSLAGSARVLNAFRTCARIGGGGQGGSAGQNPFR